MQLLQKVLILLQNLQYLGLPTNEAKEEIETQPMSKLKSLSVQCNLKPCKLVLCFLIIKSFLFGIFIKDIVSRFI